MKSYSWKMLLFLPLFLMACQNEKAESNEESDNTNIAPDKVISTFIFEIEPKKALTKEAIQKKILSKKYFPSTDKSSCACDADNCFEQQILMTHYFSENDKNQALVIIGNSCKDAAHVQSGWCDAALLQLSGQDWVMTDFWSKVGGGGSFGDVGVIGNAFQIGRNNIGIEVAGAFTGQGATFETTSIIGYLGGEVKEIARIPTYFDNFGAVLEEKNKQCFCQSYAFRPMNEADIFTLLLVKKDCTNSGDEMGCSGEAMNEASVDYDGNSYPIPEQQKLF
ncbi:MAG: hypothetical protein ACPG19_12185 [Saprospiraceae bacterium]